MDKERSAVLIHSYLDDMAGKNRPDKLTRLGILSAIELYKHGEINTICATVKTRLNDQIVEHLNHKVSSVPKEVIYTKPNAVSTTQELEEFKKIAEEQNIEKLTCIADETHVSRVKKMVRHVFGVPNNVQVISSKDILSHYSRFDNVLKESDCWPERIALRRKEKILRLLAKIPKYGDNIVTNLPGALPFKIAIDRWMVRKFAK